MANIATVDGASDLSAEQPLPTIRDFKFLRRLNPLLAEYTALATEFSTEDPEKCLLNIRKFAEYVVIYLEYATQVSTANDATNGGDGKGVVVPEKFKLRVGRFVQLPPQVRRAILDIWFDCGELGAHPPQKFLLSEKQFEDHKVGLRKEVLPALKNARIVADWVREECSNKQPWWKKWILFWREIGLKDQLPELMGN